MAGSVGLGLDSLAKLGKVVALFNLDASGHVQPMLALAEALVLDGWDVHFFTPKGARRQVEGIGARWCHYGTEDWDLFSAAERVALQQLRVEPDEELFAHIMSYSVVPATLDVLPYLLGRMALLRPRFMVYDAACPWGWVLSEVLGVPGVSSMTALPAPQWEREEHSSFAFGSARVLDATAAAIRSVYGVELNHNYSYNNYSDYTVVWTSRSWHKDNEDFCPEWFHYWGPAPPTRAAAARRAEEEEPALAGVDGRPIVYVSMGTVATGSLFPTFAPTLADFYAKMCAVAASMPGVAFVLSLGTATPVRTADSGRIAEIFDGVRVPPNATAAVWVDQQAVLDRAAAFVTHCGMNSSSEAIVRGVPVVAVPFFGDQVYNAERFAELGCGVLQRYSEGHGGPLLWAPDHSRITQESLGAAVRGLLEQPRYRDTMRALRAREMHECGGPLLEKIAGLFKRIESDCQREMFSGGQAQNGGA